jgi:hypothetical protein
MGRNAHSEVVSHGPFDPSTGRALADTVGGMISAATSRSLDGLRFLTTVIEQSIAIVFLIGVLVGVGALILWIERWAGPRTTFIPFTRGGSGRAVETARRRERSA